MGLTAAKPHFGRLDARHPLAQGLRFFCSFSGAGRPVAETGGILATVGGNSPADTVGPWGRNRTFNGALAVTYRFAGLGYQAAGAAAIAPPEPDRVTLAILFMPTSGVGRLVATSESAGYAIEVNGTTNVNFNMFGVVNVTTGLTVTAGTPTALVLVRDSSTAYRFYKRDYLTGVTTRLTAAPASSNPVAGDGIAVVTTSTYAGGLDVSAVWGRALSDAEVYRFLDDPFAPVRPVAWPVFAAPAVGTSVAKLATQINRRRRVG